MPPRRCTKCLEWGMIVLAAMGTPNPAGLVATARLLAILRNLHEEPTADDMGRLFHMLACATLAWGLGAGLLVGAVMMITGVQLNYGLSADATEREVRFMLLLSAFVHVLNALFTGLGLLTLADGDCMFLSTECAARLGDLRDSPARAQPTPRPIPTASNSRSPRGTPRSPVVGTAIADPVRVWPTLSEHDVSMVLEEAERARRFADQMREHAEQARQSLRNGQRAATPISMEQLMERPDLLPQVLGPGQRDRLIEALEEIERRWLRRPEPRFQDRFGRAAARALEAV